MKVVNEDSIPSQQSQSDAEIPLRTRDRIWPGVRLAIPVAVFVAAIWLLYREFKTIDFRDVVDSFHSFPFWVIVSAMVLTTINYLVMIGYDWLGVRLVKHPVSLWQVAKASSLSFAFGNSLGMFFGGTPIRFRLYSGWGMTPSEIVRLVFFVTLAFWIGLFSIAGLLFVITPFDLPPRFQLYLGTSRPIGTAFLGLASLYFLACAITQKPIHFFGVNFQPPPLGLGLAQAMVAGLDFLFAAATLYVLLPQDSTIGFFPFAAIYLLALILALVSNVPGGLGVLELVLVTMLPSGSHSLVASLLAYRVIYYLLPLLIAMVGFGTGTIREQLQNGSGKTGPVDSWVPEAEK